MRFDSVELQGFLITGILTQRGRVLLRGRSKVTLEHIMNNVKDP